MKNIFKFIFAATIATGMVSCTSDDFTESIFDTESPAVDPNSATAPFDQWLYDNFVEPYNTEIQYRFNLTGSQMKFQLAPADYKKSQLLAHFIKYLFYDVYNKYGEKDANGNEIFMKKYGPRIFHFIGSKAYSPTTGTETLGYASSGVKITLINVNDMLMPSIGADGFINGTYSAQDVDMLNHYQFHTMHHEFSHIMHQTKTWPVEFGQVTPGNYEPRDWAERDSTLAHSLGFTTHYGSSAATEDFVEFLSCVITDTDHRWMTTIIDCCLNGGVREGDKERVYDLIDSLGISQATLNDPSKPWNKINLYREYDQDGKETGRLIAGFHVNDAKSHNTEAGYTYDSTPYKSYTSFEDFIGDVEYDTGGEVKGMNAVLKKLEIATKWYTENWGLYLFKMREEVRQRQNNVNNYMKTVQIYDLQ